MQESKYFYKGIPLSKYCKDNKLNLKTIRAKILQKKNNPKYSNYTEQQIVNMAVESYGLGTKHMWRGMSLRQYCQKNGINYDTITSRIEKLKKENPSLSNDELVTAALEKFQSKNYHFFYEGIPLKDYCEKHPEINWQTIRSFIYSELEKNPNLPVEDIIELYLKKEHKGRYKYYYCGMPLIRYCECEENNIKYDSIMAYIKKHKKEDIGIDLSDDEYIEIIMDLYEPFKLIYQYNGLSLRQYCQQHSLSYYGIKTYVRRKLMKYPNLDINDLIEEGINTVNRYGIIYYYNGVPLKDYCKEHGINIDSIRSSILAKKNTTDIPLQEIVNECVYKYEKRLHIKKIYNLFEKLKKIKNISYDEQKKACELLKINYDNVIDLIQMNFSLNQAINIIWYFSDRKDNNDNKLISYKKISEIFDIINKIKNVDETEIMNFELYDLMGIYKSELYDTRIAMLIKQKNYLRKIIWILCQEYNIQLTKYNFEEFENEIKTYFMVVINRSCSNIYGQIIKYIDLTIKGYFRTYLKSQKQQMTCISLDEVPFNNEKETNNAKTRLDYIESKNYDDVNKNNFSEKMMTILKTLSKSDFYFIVLKFQEEYSDEELANYFQMNIDEVKENEIRILSLLKDNPNIKVLKKQNKFFEVID